MPYVFRVLTLLVLVVVACSGTGNSTIIELPRPASGDWTYNASPTIQDNLVSADGRQYAIWVDDRRHPIIASRRTGSERWEEFDLSIIDGNPLAAPTEEDGHNFYSMAVDVDGYIHIVGNHHNDPLRSIRSVEPHTIDRWEPAPMVGEDEDRITYPKFFQLDDGTLLFLYRNGRAGAGDNFLNRYNRDTRTWERVHKLVQGVTDGLSFYPNHISTRDGSIHVMGVWRGSGGANSNRDVTYFRSDDGGSTWVQADGSEQQMPVQHGNANIAVRTPPEGSGLLNGGGLEVDPEGRPHGALMMYDADGNTQIFHIWYDGSQWQDGPVTDLSHRMEMGFSGGAFADNRIGHPSVVTTASGSVFVLYRAHEHSDVLLAVDVTPGKHRCEFTAIDTPVGFWNPTYDTQALYEHNRIDMLVVPTGHPQDPDVPSEPWMSVTGRVVQIAAGELERKADDCRSMLADARPRTSP